MRLRLDVELGPLRFIFDPFPDAEETEETEPDQRSQVDTYLERTDGARSPELHKDHRDPWYDPDGRWTIDTRHVGFGTSLPHASS